MSGGITIIGNQSVLSRMITLTTSNTDVATTETSTSTSYTNLTTTGPSVTLSPGVTQTHMIVVQAISWGSSGSVNTYKSPAINGATPLDADAPNAFSNGVVGLACASKITFAASQASGNTHTQKYRCDTGTGNYAGRRTTGICI